MASINGLSTAQTFLSLLKPNSPLHYLPASISKIPSFSKPGIFSRTKLPKDSSFIVGSVANELDVIPVQSSDYTDQQDGAVGGTVEMETEGVTGEDIVNQVVNAFGNEGRYSFEAAAGYASGSGGGLGSNAEGQEGVEETETLIDRAIHAAIALAAGTFAITKLLTIDHNYWQELSCRCNTLVGSLRFLEDTVKRFDSAFVAVLIFLQLTCPISSNGWESWSILPAEAVLYSPETKIPRTGELALRRAIPANTDMKAIQDSLEDISYLLRIPQRKPYGTMEGNVKKALQVAKDEKESILSSIPAEFREKGSVLYVSLVDGKGGLQSLLGSIKDKDADKVSVDLASSLDTVAELELLQAPGLSFLLPQEYLKYPRLTGRGVVEFTIEKGDGSAFSPEAAGEPRSTATIRVVIDGYSAPLTAGNFAKLVRDGVYDGMKLNCANQAILSDGGLGNGTGYSVPLEIKPSGQFEPLYKTTLSVQDGELPVLPLSVYGAVAMAHSDVSEEYSSPNQFFFYLYDKRNAGLGGLSFDEGQFSVFGYTTGGREILSQIKTGDVIRSAKLVEGQDRLVLPRET